MDFTSTAEGICPPSDYSHTDLLSTSLTAILVDSSSINDTICQTAYQNANVNDNDILNRSEYVDFVNDFLGADYDDYSMLSLPLQDNFISMVLESNAAQVPALPLQDLCDQTRSAFGDVMMIPTASPTTTTTEEEEEDGDDTPNALTIYSAFLVQNNVGAALIQLTAMPSIEQAYRLMVEDAVSNTISVRKKNRLHARYLKVTHDPTQTIILSQSSPHSNCTSFCESVVYGRYILLLGSEDDVAGVNKTYVDSTQSAIDDGLLQQYLDQVDPSSDYSIGGAVSPVVAPVSVQPTPPPTTDLPSYRPSNMSSFSPSSAPTMSPAPSQRPSTSPSESPSISSAPSQVPTDQPSEVPTVSTAPSQSPSERPSQVPTVSVRPSSQPTVSMAPSTSQEPTFFVAKPTFPPEEEDDNKATIISVMVAAVIVALCCGYNRGYAEVGKNPQTAWKEFKDDIMHRKILVIDIPMGWFSQKAWPFRACACCNTRDLPKKRITRALFYSTRIKRRWKPQLANMQFILGWMSAVTTIIALINPENGTNNIVGFTALFLSELILHLWYGYLRYPNCATALLQVDQEGDGLFAEMRYLFNILYHGGKDDDVHPVWLDVLGLPFVLVLHVGTILGIVTTFFFCCALSAMGDDDDGKKKKRKKDVDDDEGEIAFAALVGALVGSFAYPIMFLVTTTSQGKLLAGFLHHFQHEYYEAKLFGKSGKEFFISVILKFLADFGEVDFLFEATDDGFVDELFEAKDAIKDELDVEEEKKKKTRGGSGSHSICNSRGVKGSGAGGVRSSSTTSYRQAPLSPGADATSMYDSGESDNKESSDSSSSSENINLDMYYPDDSDDDGAVGKGN